MVSVKFLTYTLEIITLQTPEAFMTRNMYREIHTTLSKYILPYEAEGRHDSLLRYAIVDITF